jgi:hypothetical protein
MRKFGGLSRVFGVKKSEDDPYLEGYRVKVTAKSMDDPPPGYRFNVGVCLARDITATIQGAHILLEEPIRLSSILEPSKANFFPAMTKNYLYSWTTVTICRGD